MLKNNVNNQKNYTLRAFLYSCIIGAAIVLPVIFLSNGYFLYYGDFNVQQIPFYTLVHDSILEGYTSWSYLTDLGSNFVGSYTFYNLTSPFFLVTLLFDTKIVPYLMGPLLILKFGFCGMTSYIYLKRYVRDKRYAVLGSVAYAFSGFSIYNVFFFHFHEAMIIFPLLLASVDEFMATKRKGVVCLAVFTACFLNYYFFFSMVVFTAIYYFVKLISKVYSFDIKSFLILAFECVLGVLMACAVLLPSLSAISDNSRVSDFLTGYDALLYSVPQRYMHIITSMFFPPDIPARANFTPDSNANWSSVALFIPLFSVTFVIGFLQMYKKSWLKRMIIVLSVMAMVPILNSAFQAFNECFYTRWFFMFTLMMVLCTIISLENIRSYDYKRAFKWSVAITLVLALSIGLMVKEKTLSSSNKVYGIGLESNPLRFYIYVAISLVALLTMFFITKRFSQNKELFLRITAIALVVFTISYSNYLIFLGKSETDHSDEFVIEHALNFGENINIDDLEEVRSDFYATMDNMAMFWQIPSIQAFHSIVPSSTMDFYNAIGCTRDVASRPETDLYGIRGLLSVKYLFDESNDGNPFVNEDGGKLMPGYKHIATRNGFDIYENTHYIPMGFMYDKFICEEEFNNLSNGVKHLALLKAMVLSQEQMKKYSEITGYEDGMYLHLNEEYSSDKPQNLAYPNYENFDSITNQFKYSYEDYFKDCKNRKATACDSFSYTKNGFTATVTNDGDDNLLFFSVPYDKGFKAYVNGNEVEIEKVNIGFMAVKIDGHTKSEIEFVYTTPMLNVGIIVSIAGFVLFFVYMISTKGFSCERKYRKIYKIKKTNV